MNLRVLASRTRMLDRAFYYTIIYLFFFITFSLASGAFAQAELKKPTISPSTRSADPVPATLMPSTAQPSGVAAIPTSASTATSIQVPKKLSLDEALGPLGLSDNTIKQLHDAKVSSVEELRKQIFKGNKDLEKLPESQKTKLRRVSMLSLLSSDPTLNAELAKYNFKSIRDIAKISPEELRQRSGNKLSLEEAKKYRKRAQGLTRFLDMQVQRLAVAGRNPALLALLPPEQQSLAQELKKTSIGTGSAPLSCSGTCDAIEDMFSPAVYLIYLLDFVEKSFTPAADSSEWNLNPLTNIDKRFFQRFENLPTSQEPALSGSSVRYSNEVLENLIAELDGKSWPNDYGLTASDRLARRKYIYNTEFSAGTYTNEPGFSQNVLSDLFNSYLREMSTTRHDMQMLDNVIKAPQEALAKRIALQQGLNLENKVVASAEGNAKDGLRISDISLLASDVVKLETLEQLREKLIGSQYGALYRWHWRKASMSVAQESIRAIKDDKSDDFDKHFRGLRSAAIDCISGELLKQIPSSSSEAEFANQLSLVNQKAKDCVNIGNTTCPAASSCRYNGKMFSVPLSPLRELFRHYADVFPAPSGISNASGTDTDDAGQFADKMIAARRSDIEKEVRLSDGVGSSEPLSLKAKQRIEDRLASEEELDHQLDLLAQEIFRRECNGDGKTAYLSEVDRRADEAWRTSVAKAEAGFITKVRTNLLAIVLHKIVGKSAPDPQLDQSGPAFLTAANVQKLADYLFMDLSIDESQRTTPLASAISRIHSFVQAARLGKVQYSTEKFDPEVWNWLQSYGVWHAAMMVTAYPESFLMPDVRRTITPQMKALMDNVETNKDLESLLKTYVEDTRAIANITLVGVLRTAQGVVILGLANANGHISLFQCVLKEDGRWLPWERIGSLKGEAGDFSKAFVAWTGQTTSSRIPTGGLLLAPVRVHVLGSTGLVSVEYKQQYRYILLQVKNGIVSLPDGEEQEWKLIPELDMEEDIGYMGTSPYSISIPKVLVYVQGFENEVRLSRIRPAKHVQETWIINNESGEWSASKLDDISNAFYGKVKAVAVDGMGAAIAFCTDDGLYLGFNNRVATSSDIGRCFNDSLTFGVEDKATSVDSKSRFFYMKRGGQTVVFEESSTGYVLTGQNYDGYAGPAPTFQHMVTTPQGVYLLGGYVDIRFGQATMQSRPRSLYRPASIRHYWEDLDLTEPITATRRWSKFDPDDPDRIYLDEYYMHIPIAIAERLTEAGRFEEAKAWLSKVYDPMAATEEERRKYPGFSAGGNSLDEIRRWFKDPFDPYALANMHGEVYLLAVRLAHVQNLLVWADKLFTRDTTEAVNRARQLYELAGSILGSTDWPTGDCALDLRTLVNSQGEAAGGFPFQQPQLMVLLKQTTTPGTVKEVQRILAQPRSNVFKRAALSSLYDAKLSGKKNLKSLLGQRVAADSNVNLEQGLQKIIAGVSDNTADEIGQAAEGLGDVTIGREFPTIDLRFCLPRNPLLNVLSWRIYSNLAKIRTGRNFAGMPRQLQPYATPVDPAKLVKQAAAGALDFEEYVPSLPPPIYRYSFLVEQAKQLAISAQQLESATLSAIEKGDEAEYRVMQARQDVQLERSNVTLQTLRVQEANDGVTLANAQKTRAEHQSSHYTDLINGGLSGAEAATLLLMFEAGGIQAQASLAAFAASSQGQPELAIQGLSYLAGSLSTFASFASTQASYERRAQEWAFQLQLANDDITIADSGITLANDRVDIAEQEKEIANLRLVNANDTVEFLQDRFTNGALYRWLQKNLRRLYREQLNMSISIARAAQRALEFERQTSLDFIAYDYWDEARSGLVGAERLLQDIDKLNQYRLSTATRKKEIEKTISVASIMPAEFQQFRRSGVLDVETSMGWFDQDFPGHYMRLIRDVSVTVLALVPPNEGIHATLSNPGISRVMVGVPFEKYSIIYRLPESIALSGIGKANGMFELNPSDPMLLPFEGSGVATTWRLELPKGANRFDFQSLYDVLFTVRYTALEDRDYRAKVLSDMHQDDEGFVKTSAVRYFSLRNDFADQWYHLLNPVPDKPESEYWDPAKVETADGKPQKPYCMVLDLKQTDFVPNEERRSIKKITLAVQLADDKQLDDNGLAIKANFRGSEGKTTLTNDSIIGLADGFSGKRPDGKWILNTFPGGLIEGAPIFSIDQAKMLRERVRDILLIIEYQALVHYNK